MRIVNSHNLPAPIVRAAEASVNSHPPKPKTRSATRLVSAPRIYQLMKRHWDDLEQDAVDLLKPMIGTAWHAHLAKYGKGMVEEFLSAEIDGWTLEGRFDLYDPETGTLTDYKTASVFSFLLGEKEEYTAQLNCYRWLLEKDGNEVKKLELAYTFTDWQWRKNVSEDYPDAPAKVVTVDMWDMVKTETYIKERFAIHKFSETLADETLPLCTDKEMWAKPEKWAVMKVGRKSALPGSLSNTEGEAVAYKFKHKDQKGLSVQHRPGERTRCERFCVLAKNDKCSQWREYLEAKSAKPQNATQD